MITVIVIGLTSCNQINRQFTSEQTVKEKSTEITDEELSTLFNKYKPTLDGAYAEGYAYELYQAYKKSNPKQFIGVLSKLDANNMKGIIELFVGQTLNNDGKSEAKKLEKVFEDLKKDTSLSRKEKYAVYEVLAKILYFKETLNIGE